MSKLSRLLAGNMKTCHHVAASPVHQTPLGVGEPVMLDTADIFLGSRESLQVQ